ncbi:MAG: FxsA family protein [Acidimicrobiales bacterium]
MFSTRAFIALLVPVAEVFTLIRVVDIVGGAVAVLALFALSALGAVLVRPQGSMALRSLADSLRGGSAPASDRLATQALRFLAAVLLAVPGFITAGISAALMVPPIRALARPYFQSLEAESFIRPLPRSRRSAVDVDIVDVDSSGPASPTANQGPAELCASPL